MYVQSVSGEKQEKLRRRRSQRERKKLRKRQKEREVSSFRFTVVVGEIWLCSYSTLRTEPEEE